MCAVLSLLLAAKAYVKAGFFLNWKLCISNQNLSFMIYSEGSRECLFNECLHQSLIYLFQNSVIGCYREPGYVCQECWW